jgi:hypothetical protein
LGALLLALTALYVRHFPTVETINDTWFGADVARHLDWMVQGVPGRAHLHPLSFALYRIAGRMYAALNLLPAAQKGAMIPGALPPILAASLAVPRVAHWLASRRVNADDESGRGGMKRQLTSAVLLVAISPLLIFAPVAESHVLGGLMLLMSAVLVLRVYDAEGETTNAAPPPEVASVRRRRITLALLFGVAATGFSLSNLIPAGIMLGLVLRRRDSFRAALALTLVVLLEGALVAWRGIFALTGAADGVVGGAQVEQQWLGAPTLQNLYLSFHHLILSQFGIPWGYLKEYPASLASHGVPFSGPFVDGTLAPLSCCAAVLWLLGVLIYARSLPARSRVVHFLRHCALILSIFVLFHAIYDPAESYIFAAHAWPFLILPGLLAWNDALAALRDPGHRHRSLAILACLGTAGVLSGLQSALAISHLLRLPSP